MCTRRSKTASLRKKTIRKAITKSIENEEWTKRTKSRNSKGFERKKYLDETDKVTMRNILSRKVNIIDVKMNYKGKYKDMKCPMCKIEEDTTEHLFERNDLKDRVIVCHKSGPVHIQKSRR